MRKLRAWWKQARLWVLVGLGAAITAAQFIFWRWATKKRDLPKPKPLAEAIDKAEVEAIEARILAKRDDELIREKIRDVAYLRGREQTEALASILRDL